MKIVILTSSLHGTASNHLIDLLKCVSCEITMVVFNQGIVNDKRKFYKSKFRKLFKIGILGTLNGIRMRKWFSSDVDKYIKTSNLKDICNEFNIPFHQVQTINCEATKQLFRLSEADLGISLGNGYISQSLFSIPKYGMVNIHHEILPDYQNAQSIIWQLYNGSSITGFTIHKIDKTIDTGEIIYQESIPIIFKNSLSDTVATTSANLIKASSKGLVQILENFDSYFYNSVPQGIGKKYTTPSISEYLRIYRNYKILTKSSAQHRI